jgi:hypothetical protein
MREQVTYMYMCRNPVSCRRPGMRGFFPHGMESSFLCRVHFFNSKAIFYPVYIYPYLKTDSYSISKGPIWIRSCSYSRVGFIIGLYMSLDVSYF